MNYSWPSLVTLAICLTCATIQLYWGGQDKQGQFHAEYLVANGNLGMSLFFLGPYFLFAVSSLIVWRQRAMDGRLVLIAVLCAIGVMAGWVEHDQYLRTPPGRETQPMLNFVATLGLWLFSVVLLVAIGVSRLATTRSSGTDAA
ncbi:MAG: hypothetical protein IAG10_10990 [Planctomycetaceae bacterium]|nr:hypothetical protein [Planctomycetaceae bacterium]